MRPYLPVFFSLLCAACANAPQTGPREYLDEQTAATITVVAEPWIYSREGANATLDQRDFLHLYAIDVNRMGVHRQYLAVLQSAPLVDEAGGQTAPPVLQLRLGEELVAFEAETEDPRALGLAEPVAQSYTVNARWWYYGVDKSTLARIAAADPAGAMLVAGEVRAPYMLWRDGREDISALTTVLP